MIEVSENNLCVISHYDLLIEEENDPVYDPLPLREYMNQWDGPTFIRQMELEHHKTVLEIGVGTGRLALKTAPLCGQFYGVDISPKTIERAKENLRNMPNVHLSCDDFLSCSMDCEFDVIYSSLTFMHIADKQRAMNKIAGLLRTGGRLVLSIDRNDSEYIDIGSRRIKVYPDTPCAMRVCMQSAGLTVINQYETKMATIFVAENSKGKEE